MCRKAFALVALLAGCSSAPRYREGTNLLLGIYLPTSEGLVGLQIVDYLNGCELRTATNMPFTVSRKFAATNSYFGVVHTVESSETAISSSTR